MNETVRTATETLREQIGQDKIMVLATRNGDGVAARTVNIYTYGGCFYFITEADSNKYTQISQNAQVALSIDAIQITGCATLLEHPCSASNKLIAAFVEKQLPQQFARYAAEPVMRLIRVNPVSASFILLETGAGYVIDFAKNTAIPIQHEMQV
ncbi:pyridoxamine 5'-phosphate oxidase family protein|uniref:Pyridoxamine 5'-phosphate oxidase n=1 Tax=Dendrosporobacter quercicolus TaxID=146817 RepID=A0A1G9TYR7_9FIRM|nr:pyridoxamine 5'-phosphate oxidase family protein [Dendrosporobacter quercicolus]NSL48820.1 pyridoxamine 5'-phosphate oxidase family protein [Dendrosporobacter quercicolus DSM 1736]SDM52395.1 Pyridoxamine 5'-phosphate oxidase [Dendrosporobacter quercicolus]